MSLTKKLLVFPPIALGVAVLILAVSCREGAELRPPGEQALKARTIVVKKHTVLPRALAFGSAEPKSVWRGIAQVSGQVASVHSGLNPGELLPKGTVLLTIDRTDYGAGGGAGQGFAAAGRGGGEQARGQQAQRLGAPRDRAALAEVGPSRAGAEPGPAKGRDRHRRGPRRARASGPGPGTQGQDDLQQPREQRGPGEGPRGAEEAQRGPSWPRPSGT